MISTLFNNWRRVLGMNGRNVHFVEAHNPARHRRLADDKLCGKEALSAAGVPVPVTLAEIRDRVDGARFLERAPSLGGFALKPARGKGGQGIVIVKGFEKERFLLAGGGTYRPSDLEHHVVDTLMGAFSGGRNDRAFAEELLLAHPSFENLSTGGLPDLRVITLLGEAQAAMLRTPTEGSQGRANLHQGGLGIGIDLESGLTTGGWWKRQRLLAHPDTGYPLVGVRIPLWKELLETACRASRAVPLGYLGIDLTVDAHRGPLVIELNVRPGLEIQNVSNAGLSPKALASSKERAA